MCSRHTVCTFCPLTATVITPPIIYSSCTKEQLPYFGPFAEAHCTCFYSHRAPSHLACVDSTTDTAPHSAAPFRQRPRVTPPPSACIVLMLHALHRLASSMYSSIASPVARKPDHPIHLPLPHAAACHVAYAPLATFVRNSGTRSHAQRAPDTASPPYCWSPQAPRPGTDDAWHSKTA